MDEIPITCAECRRDIPDPGIAVVRGEKREDGRFYDEGSVLVCSSHYFDRIPLHKLEQVRAGPLYMLVSVTSREPGKGYLNAGSEMARTEILGYLFPGDARAFFTRAYNKLESLEDFNDLDALVTDI